MKRLGPRSLGSVIGLITVLASASVHAQSGSFPPTIPTNPFTDAQGHQYSISFVDVVNVLASPDDNSVNPQPALATHTTSYSIVGVPMPFSTLTQTAFTDTLHSSSQQGTRMSSTTDLWRIADTSIGYNGFGGNYQNYTENFYGQPVFRFKIQKLDTSNVQYVPIRIACGVSGQAQAKINGIPHVPLNTNASAMGTLFNSSLSASASPTMLGVAPPGYISIDDKSGQRFIDFFTNSTYFNSSGVAYFMIQASPTASISFSGGQYSVSLGADSKWEFVVLSLQ